MKDLMPDHAVASEAEPATIFVVDDDAQMRATLSLLL